MVAVLLLSFDGTNYCGWQVQPNATTVQGLIEQAVQKALQISTKVVGCSRTDAGVHAAGYVCSFRLPENFSIPPKQIAFAVNCHLPQDIQVLQSAVVENNDFHACTHAVKKWYRYSFYCNKIERPLLQRYATRVYPVICLEKMQKCAILLQGTKDFKAFSNTGSDVKTTIRTIYGIEIYKQGELYHIEVCGDGFLYNMVRILAGSLIAVGQGKIEPQQLLNALEKRDRALTGRTMPANALTLLQVEYDRQIF